MNGGSIVGINKYIFKIYLQIGDDLRTIHNDQLVNRNHQDIALTLPPDLNKVADDYRLFLDCFVQVHLMNLFIDTYNAAPRHLGYN